MRLKVPPPLLGFIAAVFIWLAAYLLPSLTMELPLRLLLALLFFSTGLGIDLISVFSFFKAGTTVNPMSPDKTQTLVTNGMFKFSRNPMYLGMLLMLIGWAIWNGNVVGILPILFFVFAINQLQIKPEENTLQHKFGAEYERYKNRVRRWI